MKCWGDDEFHLLEVPSGNFTSVSVADTYACGLTDQATVTCWPLTAPELFKPTGTVVQLSSNAHATCARSKDGTVVCYGSGTVESVPPGTNFTDVSAGLNNFACGLDASGRPVLGDVSVYGGVAMPPTDDKFAQLTVSANIACGLHADGSARCWGYSPDPSVFDVPADERFSVLAVGGDHVCGLRKTDSTVLLGARYRSSDRSTAVDEVSVRLLPCPRRERLLLLLGCGAAHHDPCARMY